MSEKLCRCKCSVPGHGTECVVSHEIAKEQKAKAKKLRRAQDRAETMEGK